MLPLTTTPLVLVVAVCWLVLLVLVVLPAVPDKALAADVGTAALLDSSDGLGGALPLLSTASALDAALTGDGWW